MSTALVPLQVNEKDTDALDAVARSLAYTYLKEDKRERKQKEKITVLVWYLIQCEYTVQDETTQQCMQQCMQQCIHTM